MDEYEKGYSEGFQDGLQYNAERETEWNTENFKNGWEEGFEMGLQEANKCIRKILVDGDFPNAELFNLFGFFNPFEVIRHNNIKDIVTKIKTFEKGEDECK